MARNITNDNDVNFLLSNSYHIEFINMPYLSLFATEVDFPGVNAPNAIQPTPMVDIPIPGEKMDFDPLTITFNVDEYFRSYYEIYLWMVSIGFPIDTEQFRKMKIGDTAYPENGVSDMVLSILSSKSNPILIVKFIDAFPTNLSSFQLTEKQAEPMPIIVNATFSYSYFTVEFLG